MSGMPRGNPPFETKGMVTVWKKRVLALLLALPVLFVGCGKQETPQQIQEQTAQIVAQDFVSGAAITYGNLQLSAQLVKNTKGETTLTVESPETIKGLKMTAKDGEVELEYRGLSTSVDPDSFVGKTLLQTAVKALNMAGNPQGISVTQTDGGVQLVSSTQGMDFTLTLDQETGHFLELSVPEESLVIRFDNFQFADPPENQEETGEAAS